MEKLTKITHFSKRQKVNSKEERIVKIYEILSKEALNITELASRVNVSTKTIERDLKNPLLANELQKNGQAWSVNPNSQKAFVTNVLENFALAFGANFYKKAKKLIGGGSSDLLI